MHVKAYHHSAWHITNNTGALVLSLSLLFNKVLTNMIQVLRRVRVHTEQNMEGWAACGAGGSGEKEKENNAIQDKDGES